MKKLTVLVFVLVLLCSPAAYATLIDNEDGTITQIRPDGSMLMWLQDANFAQTFGYNSHGRMYWHAAQDWIEALNAMELLGYDDWRLPITLPVNGIAYNNDISFDGSTDVGRNVTVLTSELAYMYHVELGNLNYYDTEGNRPQDGWGLLNTGLFAHLQPFDYWTGSAYTSLDGSAVYPYVFSFEGGKKGLYPQTGGQSAFVWAVRDVPTPVPEPATLLLLSAGLLGIARGRKRTI